MNYDNKKKMEVKQAIANSLSNLTKQHLETYKI